MNMLGSWTHSNEARRYYAQDWEPLQELDRERQRVVSFSGGSPGDNAPMNLDLDSLNHAGGPFTPLLHLFELGQRDWPLFQFSRQQIGGGDGVLQGEVDTDA